MDRIIKIAFLLLLTAHVSIAQVTMSGEIRPRSEYSHGYSKLSASNQDASFFTTQRTRLNLGYKSDALNSKLVFQDVRLWGSQAQLTNNEDFAVSIHEAWAETKLLGNIWLKVGRQELVYDDQRILGNVGWAQQGRSHDVAVLKMKSNIEVNLGFAFHQNADRTNNLFDGNDAYKAMQFLWLNKKTDQLSASLLVLNNGVPLMLGEEQETVYSQTLGTHVTYKASNALAINANVYYQTGSIVITGSKKELSAYNLLLEAVYKTGNLKFEAGNELLSGNDISNTTKIQAFNPLYGTNHKFNGYMDYFYVGNHLNSTGLNDAYLKASYAKDKQSIALDAHIFSSASASSADAAGYLGTEMDATYSFKFTPEVQLSIGYSQIFGNSRLQNLKGGNSGELQNWAYIMFSFQPQFIK